MKFKAYPLVELATIRYGKNQSKVVCNKSDIPIYGTGGKMGYAQIPLYEKPSVLIGRKGTIGKVKYVDHPFWTVDTLFYTEVNEQLVLPHFLYYAMSLIDLNKYNEGTTIPSLRTETLNRLELMVPSIDDQKKVLSILERFDEKITLNRAINHNLQQQAKAIFDEWFIKIPQSTQDTLKITPLGYFPDSFSVVKTGELPIVVADYVANGSFASLKENVKLHQSKNYAYFIRNTDLKSGSFEVFVDKHSYDFLSKSRLFGGEIIISNVGDVGSVFLCPTLDAPMTLGNNIIMIKSDIPELRLFLYIWFKWSLGQGLIQGIKSGSAQPKFNKTDFKNLPIILPPSELLQKFNSTVSPIFEMIERNDNENRKLPSLRDSILPKLMSGEIDVSEVEV